MSRRRRHVFFNLLIMANLPLSCMHHAAMRTVQHFACLAQNDTRAAFMCLWQQVAELFRTTQDALGLLPLEVRDKPGDLARLLNKMRCELQKMVKASGMAHMAFMNSKEGFL